MLRTSWLGVHGCLRAAGLATGILSMAALQGCTAVTAGQLVQAGYDAARTSWTGAVGGAPGAEHERLVMNSISVGQEVAPILDAMGVPPKEKSGNPQGYVCYQYAGVYSATEDAVVVSRNGKVAFFGNSTCRDEMQASNFGANGKYAPGTNLPAGTASPADVVAPAGAAAPAGVPASAGAASDAPPDGVMQTGGEAPSAPGTSDPAPAVR